MYKDYSVSLWNFYSKSVTWWRTGRDAKCFDKFVNDNEPNAEQKFLVGSCDYSALQVLGLAFNSDVPSFDVVGRNKASDYIGVILGKLGYFVFIYFE